MPVEHARAVVWAHDRVGAGGAAAGGRAGQLDVLADAREQLARLAPDAEPVAQVAGVLQPDAPRRRAPRGESAPPAARSLDQPLRELPHALAAEHGREVRGASAGGRDDRPGQRLAELARPARGRARARRCARAARRSSPARPAPTSSGPSSRALRLTRGYRARSKQPSMRLAGPARLDAARAWRRTRPISAHAARRAVDRPQQRPHLPRAPASAATCGRATPPAARRTGRPPGRPARTRGSRGRTRTPRARSGRRRPSTPVSSARIRLMRPRGEDVSTPVRLVGRARGQAEAARDAAVEQLGGEDAAPLGRRCPARWSCSRS